MAMVRRVVMVLALVLCAAPFVAQPVAAGGFCMGGGSADSFLDDAGTRVVMKNNCFGPTVLRVDEGETVTFTNKDSTPHTVGGVAGVFGDAHKELLRGDSAAFAFNEPGVFPYVCLYHPGMAVAAPVGEGPPPR